MIKLLNEILTTLNLEEDTSLKGAILKIKVAVENLQNDIVMKDSLIEGLRSVHTDNINKAASPVAE